MNYKAFFRSVGSFFQTENRFCLVVFSDTPKNETEETTRLFSVGFVLQPTATKNRLKPAGVFGEKTKNRPEPLSVPVYFRLTTPVAT